MYFCLFSLKCIVLHALHVRKVMRDAQPAYILGDFDAWVRQTKSLRTGETVKTNIVSEKNERKKKRKKRKQWAANTRRKLFDGSMFLVFLLRNNVQWHEIWNVRRTFFLCNENEDSSLYLVFGGREMHAKHNGRSEFSRSGFVSQPLEVASSRQCCSLKGLLSHSTACGATCRYLFPNSFLSGKTSSEYWTLE